ncbi:MAG: hypothetical protein A2452_02945 [Candidatus Firestonebacteria bacterium RIFOXYC2_FULL_39_67]|nr:MAG: hypothetical protein A2536_02360 [Candidatus Firestonebacteria bacterium RIFOXYD2_FULL_39_29]OGF55413.1 MAG: hypothetical protein A2452_02945 [Candidatus Firestonebacteria bacterium RIFOXYC2_FULL_39_67]OGF57945.1 MAG: hypothetical protein A2497_06700 [Candidatus Firestonebacteria bacterium RifOxyC12_full_39_7]
MEFNLSRFMIYFLSGKVLLIIHATFPPEARSHQSSCLVDIHGVTYVVFCGILAIKQNIFSRFNFSF